MRNRTAWLLIALSTLPFLGGAGVAAWVAWRVVPPRPVPAAPDVLAAEQAAGRAEAAAAFTDVAPPSPEQVAEFAPVLNRLGLAIKANDPAGVTACFDEDRMGREFVRAGALTKVAGNDLAGANRRGMARGVMTAIGPALVGKGDLFDWDETRVRRVRLSADGNEAVVIAVHDQTWAAEPTRNKIRWWLVKTPGGWKVYDFEDLTLGTRMSVLMAGAMTPDLVANAARFRAAGQAVQAALQAAVAGNTEAAEAELAKARGVPVVPPVAAMREVVEGLVALQKSDPAAALRHLDEADRQFPDMPVVLALRATALNQLERYDEAAAAGKRYLDQLGPDEVAGLQAGIALEKLGRPEEAAAAYRLCLDEAPDNPEGFAGLRRVLPPGGRGELAGRFGRMKNPELAFRETAESALAENDLDGAATLAGEFQKLRPAAAAGWSMAAHVEIRRKNPAEAARLLSIAARKATPEEKPGMVTFFVHNAATVKLWQEGYDAVAGIDRRLAFRTLADRINGDLEDLDGDDGDDEEALTEALTRLTAAHRKADPADYYPDLSDGRELARAKDFAEADEAYQAAQKKLPKTTPPAEPAGDGTGPGDDREELRTLRVEAWYHLGKGVAALAEFGPEAFPRLAEMFDTDKDGDGLDQLLARYKPKPKDEAAAYYRASVPWLRKDYKAAAAAFKKFRAESLVKPEGQRWPRFDWPSRDRLVRSLVRAKDVAGAKAELAGDEGPSLLKVLVAAAAGDVPGTLTEMTAFAGDVGQAPWLYGDEDLGPLLRGPKFQPVRDKFPPPPPAAPKGPVG